MDSIGELGRQTHKVVEDVKELGHLARGSASRGFEELHEKGRRAASGALERVGDYEERAARYVSDRPLKSVLLAVGVGVLLGFFVRRTGQ